MKYKMYKKTVGWALLAYLLLFVTSCKEDKETTTGFFIDKNEVEFVNNGGEVELAIASSEAWSAESDADWCMVSPANGTGSGVCIVKADSSYLYKSRTATVHFYSESGSKQIVIKQFGYEPTIEFTKSELTVPSYASPKEAYAEIEASSNVPFKITIPESAKEWLSIEGKDSYEPSTTIPRKESFKIHFKTYTEASEDRIAEVEFTEVKPATKSGEAPQLLVKKVKIIQTKAQRIIPSREGDSLALLAISRTIGLGNYNWPTSRPITHWNDVVTEERTYRYTYGGIDKDSTELRVIGVRYFMFDTNESIPYQVKYMTEMENFIAIGNVNRSLKNIDLGPEITTLKKLKSLSLMGYGIQSLPNEMANMQSLEELDLSGNNFLKLPMNILLPLPNLKYLDFRANRMQDGVVNLQTDIPRDYTIETIGMGGELPPSLFTMNKLEYLYLSYNYFYGSIPEMQGMTDVMPNLKVLALNLNRLTGKLPNWILSHKRLACWDPFILLFSQEGYDQTGKLANFDNAPQKISDLMYPECPDYKDEDLEIALKLPALSENDVKTKVPLHGHWRYYKMLNK